MVPAIRGQLDEIREICRRHDVLRLDIFGSANDPSSFDESHSDVDFIVSFMPGKKLGPWLGAYFDLRDELARLLQRQVDLVMEGAITDPRFRREADKTRRTIYVSQGTEAA